MQHTNDKNELEEYIDELCRQTGLTMSFNLEEGATKEGIEETVRIIQEFLKSKHK